MKRSFLLAAFVATVAASYAQQAGYNIPITLRPYKNQYVYLGYHYGKLKALADSTLLNEKSAGVFKGAKALPGGIYFIISPQKEILFEMLLDKQQHFSIKADSGAFQNIIFTGSPDNTLFQTYSRSVNKSGTEITALNKQLSNARSKADSAKIISQIDIINKQIQQVRSNTEKQNPGSLLAALLRAMKEPVIPPAEKQPGGKYDTVFAYQYFKSHYWDGISFTDERLLRTPIFEGKLEKYYRDLVVPDADSIKKEVDAMLLSSRSNKEMYKFLLIHFIQKYVNPPYMGQDAVFVHIFEKYINDHPEVDWFTEKYRKYIYDRAYSLMANLIGQPAAELQMVDTLDKPLPLYSVNAPYTIVCFWDATCSHCKEMIPHLDSLFQNKWKQQGVKLYGVMSDGGKEAWMNYIREHGLKDWIHVYQTEAQKEADNNAGRPGYKQLYDVYQTPVLYLLDKDKRIIAKKLAWDQMNEVLIIKMKK